VRNNIDLKPLPVSSLFVPHYAARRHCRSSLVVVCWKLKALQVESMKLTSVESLTHSLTRMGNTFTNYGVQEVGYGSITA
jgi:hypothetical protein